MTEAATHDTKVQFITNNRRILNIFLEAFCIFNCPLIDHFVAGKIRMSTKRVRMQRENK
jgi:hypothetical protein